MVSRLVPSLKGERVKIKSKRKGKNGKCIKMLVYIYTFMLWNQYRFTNRRQRRGDYALYSSLHPLHLPPSPVPHFFKDAQLFSPCTEDCQQKQIYAYSCDNLHCKAILKKRRDDESTKSALPSNCVCNMIQYNKVKCIKIESTVFYSLGL